MQTTTLPKEKQAIAKRQSQSRATLPSRHKKPAAPETVTFCCPACTRILSLEHKYAGLDGPCPKCGEQIIAADPKHGKQARVAGMPEAPMERTVWTPPNAKGGKLAPTEPQVYRPKPPPMGKKISKISDMPRVEGSSSEQDKEMQQRLKKAMSKRERMSLSLSSIRQKLRDPSTLSWIRTILSLLAIGAVVAGILLLRSKS